MHSEETSTYHEEWKHDKMHGKVICLMEMEIIILVFLVYHGNCKLTCGD